MKNVRPIDAVYLRRKVVQMHDRLLNKPQNVATTAALATLGAIQSLIDKTVTLEVELPDVVSCDGCAWKGVRHQKCTCCRRNQNIKDNFKPGGARIG